MAKKFSGKFFLFIGFLIKVSIACISLGTRLTSFKLFCYDMGFDNLLRYIGFKCKIENVFVNSIEKFVENFITPWWPQLDHRCVHEGHVPDFEGA